MCVSVLSHSPFFRFSQHPASRTGIITRVLLWGPTPQQGETAYERPQLISSRLEAGPQSMGPSRSLALADASINFRNEVRSSSGAYVTKNKSHQLAEVAKKQQQQKPPYKFSSFFYLMTLSAQWPFFLTFQILWCSFLHTALKFVLWKMSDILNTRHLKELRTSLCSWCRVLVNILPYLL